MGFYMSTVKKMLRGSKTQTRDYPWKDIVEHTYDNTKFDTYAYVVRNCLSYYGANWRHGQKFPPIVEIICYDLVSYLLLSKQIRAWTDSQQAVLNHLVPSLFQKHFSLRIVSIILPERNQFMNTNTHFWYWYQSLRRSKYVLPTKKYSKERVKELLQTYKEQRIAWTEATLRI